MAEITFPDDLVEQMAQVYTVRTGVDFGNKNDHSAMRMLLDLNGFDSADPQVWNAARLATRKVACRKASEFNVMGKFYDVTHMTNERIGELLGIPKSTVQAMACGRIAERYTAEQREAFRQLVVFLAEELRECLDGLA